MIEARLQVVGGNEKEEFQLELPATIGRGQDNSITLRDALISRQHCRISLHEGVLVVNDLDSMNGTYVGSERIHGQTQLPPGTLLTVGTVTFRAIYNDASGNIPDFAALDQGAGNIFDGDTVDIGEAGTVIDPDEITQPAVIPAPVKTPHLAKSKTDDTAKRRVAR